MHIVLFSHSFATIMSHTITFTLSSHHLSHNSLYILFTNIFSPLTLPISLFLIHHIFFLYLTVFSIIYSSIGISLSISHTSSLCSLAVFSVVYSSVTVFSIIYSYGPYRYLSLSFSYIKCLFFNNILCRIFFMPF